MSARTSYDFERTHVIATNFSMLSGLGVAILIVVPLLMIAIRLSTSRIEAVGLSLGIFCGLVVGTLYGIYLDQPHLLMIGKPWPMIGAIVLGSIIGFVAAMKTRNWWHRKLATLLDWIALRIPRRMHFGLRSVFILITISAIGLGILAHRNKMQRTVQELIDRNLSVSFDYQRDPSGGYLAETQSPTPRWLRRVVGEDYFRTVIAVRHMGNVDIRDEDMRHLGSFPDLVVLDLHNNRISRAGLHQIAHLTMLKRLDLRDNWVEDAGLQELSGMTNLRHLDISENKFSDAGLVHLLPLTQLSTLDLSDNNLTGEGLRHLKGLSELEYLYLSENNIREAELSSI